MRSTSRCARRICAAVKASYMRRSSEGCDDGTFNDGASVRAAGVTSSTMCEEDNACEENIAWVAMVSNSVGLCQAFPLFAFLDRCVARFVCAGERGSRMAFMRSAHAENILCRVACNRRTIVRQMPMNATCVTGLSQDEHIADTGVERKFFREIFFAREGGRRGKVLPKTPLPRSLGFASARAPSPARGEGKRVRCRRFN
jgi:hypothetical protein